MSVPGANDTRTIMLEYYSWLRKELGVASDDAATSGEGSAITNLTVASGTTVRALMEEHARASEAFERIVYELEGQRLRESVALIINGRVIELAGGLDRELEQGDELLLLPGFSGG
jgi:molybdopterin converting factor small subunit